jgi:hypothetical protein
VLEITSKIFGELVKSEMHSRYCVIVCEPIEKITNNKEDPEKDSLCLSSDFINEF